MMSGSIGFVASLFIVLVVAVGNIITRAVPFVLFGGKRKIPLIIDYLGKYLPPAIIAILVIYCIKDIQITGHTHGIPELIGIATVAALHMWKKNVLLSIGVGTVLYMVLVQMVFV